MRVIGNRPEMNILLQRRAYQGLRVGESRLLCEMPRDSHSGALAQLALVRTQPRCAFPDRRHKIWDRMPAVLLETLAWRGVGV